MKETLINVPQHLELAGDIFSRNAAFGKREYDVSYRFESIPRETQRQGLVLQQTFAFRSDGQQMLGILRPLVRRGISPFNGCVAIRRLLSAKSSMASWITFEEGYLYVFQPLGRPRVDDM